VRNFLNISYFLVIVTLLFYLSLSSIFSLDIQKCNKVEIKVDNEHELFFINSKIIEDMIFSIYDSLVGKSVEDINIYLLEEFVNDHPHIKKAELYLSLNGVLSIDIIQQKPVVRVFEGERSYYLNEEMCEFPLSNHHSARVLQVYWEKFTIQRLNILEALIELIKSDKFLNAQVTAIAFDEDNEIVIYPRFGNHKIILGEARDLRYKFDKLKFFYSQGLKKLGWNRYSMINLKYFNQVVCTKK